MILDATAGNRTMWRHKSVPGIIYIDIERYLRCKPTIFADNTCTPFHDNNFNTIFYDPPHAWYGAEHRRRKRGDTTHTNTYDMRNPRKTYYGWDKYQSKGGLMGHIYKAQIEFSRILKGGGLLWLKWNEFRIPLKQVLKLFTNWTVLMILYIKSPTQTAGKHQTFWVCMQKKEGTVNQRALESFL